MLSRTVLTAFFMLAVLPLWGTAVKAMPSLDPAGDKFNCAGADENRIYLGGPESHRFADTNFSWKNLSLVGSAAFGLDKKKAISNEAAFVTALGATQKNQVRPRGPIEAPEPGTFILLGAGFLAIPAFGRKLRKKNAL